MKLAYYFTILLLLSGVLVTACVSPAPQTPPGALPQALETVRVAYTPTTSFGPLFIGKDEGYFSRQGISLEFEKVQSITTALPLLVNGDIAVTGGPVSPGLINAVAKGANIRIVADKGSIAPGFCTATALMVRKDLFDNGTVTHASDLRGRKITGITGDNSYSVTRVLAMGNLTTDDVEIVNMDYASSVVAFQNGAIDAGALNEPFITQARNSGSAVILVPGEEYMPYYPYPLYYGPAILDNNTELGRRFMVAYLQSVRQYNEGKTERNLAILGNYTGLDRDLLNQSCWLPVAGNGNVSREPIREYMDWMYANNKITGKLDDSQLYDTSYAAYANGVLGNTTNNR
jgi:NitT/TauT family transport system substrate-binding protein